MRHVALFSLMILSGVAMAGAPLQLTSPSVHPGKPLAMEQVFSGFGCTGKNLSPELAWQNVPAGTKSLALTVYDPDAPTGSGFWHWIVYDIPANTTKLPAGIGPNVALPAGAKAGKNDFGNKGYDGACPPQGAKAHRYIFTLYALKVDQLPVQPDASAAMIGFALNGNMIAKATLTGTFGR